MVARCSSDVVGTNKNQSGRGRRRREGRTRKMPRRHSEGGYINMQRRARFQIGRSAEGENCLRREEDTRRKPVKDKVFDHLSGGEDQENLAKKERG